MLIATEPMKLPPLGVIAGVATVETIAGAAIAKVKAEARVTPPPAALMLIEKLPVGVDPLVAMLRRAEHVGLHDVDENEPVAPEGRPETLKATA